MEGLVFDVLPKFGGWRAGLADALRVIGKVETGLQDISITEDVVSVELIGLKHGGGD